MDMLDTLVKVVEKLIELLKHRREMEEKTFDLVVAPLYTDLMAIHGDYLRLFETCRQNLADRVELSRVAQELRHQRLEREALRDSVVSLVRVFRENERLRPYRDFFDTVTAYMSGYEDNAVHGRISSNSTSLLSAMETYLAKRGNGLRRTPETPALDPYAWLKSSAETVLEHLRLKWDEVCTEYARLSAGRTAA
jgi:hypothetical protein